MGEGNFRSYGSTLSCVKRFYILYIVLNATRTLLPDIFGQLALFAAITSRCRADLRISGLAAVGLHADE